MTTPNNLVLTKTPVIENSLIPWLNEIDYLDEMFLHLGSPVSYTD